MIFEAAIFLLAVQPLVQPFHSFPHHRVLVNLSMPVMAVVDHWKNETLAFCDVYCSSMKA